MAAGPPVPIEPAVLEIPVPTGQVVRGQRWGGARGAVAILIHAPGEDLDAWDDFPAYLAAGGLAVVAFDLPGHGLSDDPWEPSCLVDTIQAVVHGVRDGGARRVFLVAAGASVPGALRVGAAGRAAALVMLSPEASDTGPDVADLRVATLPKLLLVGAGEECALAAARRLFDRCAGWTVLSTLPTPEQGTRLLVGSWGEQAREQVVAFLRDYQVVNPSG